MPDMFRCFLVEQAADRSYHGAVTSRSLDELPAGDVVVRVAYSSLNFKDALSAGGHPGVTRKFPHIPGIDAVGQVVSSADARYSPGDEVLITGRDLGQNTWGGYAEFIRVSADWVLPLPKQLSPREAMIYGTAGLTAGLCLEALQRNGVLPDSGQVVVTGASGGVGSIAVAILAQLGYSVVAVSGKPAAHALLSQLGAAEIVDRSAVLDNSEKPLLAERWAGAVDTVGGATLGTLLRSTRHSGCVTACGLVGGTDLPTSVYPFILRGVTLAGIDSVYITNEVRTRVWQKLAAEWRPPLLDELATEEIGLGDLPSAFERIRQGQIIGRVLVRPSKA
jgi:putative YhdH/YhfP family quinone oxidoreductase